MGSLTVCIKKAGDALHADDKAAIIERSRQLRAEGVDVAEAAMRAVDEQIAAVEAMAAAAPAPRVVVSPNTIVTDSAADAIRERLRKNRNRLASGIDPQDMLDGITLAVYHIERGARTWRTPSASAPPGAGCAP